MRKPPEILELTPHAVAAGGDCVARDGAGRVVFITGALPGEQVRAAVVAQRSHFVRARVVEVVEASGLRIRPPCPEFVRGCGSCQWQHITVAGQRLLKLGPIEEALRRVAGIEDPVIQPMVELPARDYRTTVRAGVVKGRAGYRKAKRHDVLTVGSCGVAHPLIEELLVQGRYGRADEVVLRCGARTGERLAAPHPVGATMTLPADVRRDHIHEVAAGRSWRISARSFFQSRPDGADALASLIAAAAAGLGTPGRAVDLYSGVGLFAGVLAGAGWAVTSVEGSRVCVADAQVNLAGDDVDVVCANVTAWRAGGRAERCHLVVANPSRHGLAADGVAAVAAFQARRMVLVSCEVGAFGRDARLLREAGYSLTSVTPVDMFPHTFHVEIVSVFDRA